MIKAIITALHEEARPLIQYFGLKKDPQSHRVPLYRIGDTCLVVSGTGKVKAAIATTFILAQTESPENTIAINFGLCGCCDTRRPTGELVYIKKITEADTKRDFYPEIILKHNLREASVTTFDSPVIAGAVSPSSDMVDMEASGFFMAASTLIPLQNILCLKLISDHLEGGKINKSLIREKIEGCLEPFAFILDLTVILNSRPSLMSRDDASLLTQLGASLKLTTTQRHQLKDWAEGYIVRQRHGLDGLESYLKSKVKNKAERNRVLESIKHELTVE